MKRQVKICGLTRETDVEAAIAAGADYLGFIVECPSKRRLTVVEASKLAMPAKGIIPRVAVTVNADDDLIARIIDQMQPGFIQLHGGESADRVAQIAKAFGVKTIKAIPVSTQEDLKAAMEFANIADLILLDAQPPKGSDIRGGHGMAIDWSIIAGASLPKTYLLAGGLSPENVRQAIAMTDAPVLDVCSGVERSPGIKGHAKLEAFVKAAKGR